MKGKRLTIRWLRVAGFVTVVPVFWVMVGVPVAALVWTGLVILAACMFVALRLGWGTTTRSIGEVLHDLDESGPIAIRVTSAASTPAAPRARA